MINDEVLLFMHGLKSVEDFWDNLKGRGEEWFILYSTTVKERSEWSKGRQPPEVW